MTTLCVIPSYVRSGGDVELLAECLSSLRKTAGLEPQVVVVDDGSSDKDLVSASAQICTTAKASFFPKDENSGFSATVNVGLRLALDSGWDAVLVNSDIVFHKQGWLDRMERQERIGASGLADVVGAMLIYPDPSRLIQHGGIYFSLLTRHFDHLWKFAPANLSAARVPAVVPVTGALQFIRHATLRSVGTYDESFKMGYEDVDYCIRVMLAGGQCIYQPAVQALHGESMIRGQSNEKIAKWSEDSFLRLMSKYRDQSFAGLVPFQ